MKSLMCLVAGAMILGSASLAAGQQALLNTFPTSGGQMFNPDSWRVVRGPESTAGSQVATGHLFTAQASGTVASFLTVLRHIDGQNSYRIQIRQGDANQVGAVLGEWQLEGSSAPLPFAGSGGGSVTLTQGQTYWMTLIADGSAHGAWHLNTQGFSGEWSQSTNGGITFLLVNGSQLPAIRFVPEGFPPGCSADWDRNGAVNSQDISAYIATWLYSVLNGTLEADFNGCGIVNSSDISAFITAWLAQIPPGGC